jgi:hypothetical protein
MSKKLAWVLALVAVHGAAIAAEEDAISTDRPDFVDSSDVVGKGRVQIEAGFAQDRNRDAGLKERTSSTPLLLRFGVSDDLELRVQTDGRMRYRADGAAFARERGWGDSALSVKWHVRDGEGAMPAFGVIGQLDFASGSQAFKGSGTRPSLRATAEWELAPEWSIGVMPGLLADRDDQGRHFTSGMLGVSLDRGWTERLHTYFELAAPQIAKAHNGGTTSSFDFGGTYLLTKDCQLDAGLSRGLNHRTADYSFTFGLSVRL